MTSGLTYTPRSGRPPADGGLTWRTLGADRVLHSEAVDGCAVSARLRQPRRRRTPAPASSLPGWQSRPGTPSSPVQRPDADRAARRGYRQHLPAQAAWHGRPADPADAVQRGHEPAAGGPGRRVRRRPAEDDDYQGQGEAGPPGLPEPAAYPTATDRSHHPLHAHQVPDLAMAGLQVPPWAWTRPEATASASAAWSRSVWSA
jgi:hypothetical protein